MPSGVYPRSSVEDRFWFFVNKKGPIPEHRPDLGACWVWTGYLRMGRIYIGFQKTVGIAAHVCPLDRGNIVGIRKSLMARTMCADELQSILGGE